MPSVWKLVHTATRSRAKVSSAQRDDFLRLLVVVLDAQLAGLPVVEAHPIARLQSSCHARSLLTALDIHWQPDI